MYRVVFTEQAKKQFSKLDHFTQRMILQWIEKNLEGCSDPKAHGKALSANRTGQWRYRIGDYRILVLIKDNELVILVIKIGHRREVYSDK